MIETIIIYDCSGKTQPNEGPMFDTTNSTSTWLFAIDKKITCHLCEPVLRISSSNLCKFQKDPGNKRKQTDEPGWFQRVSLSCRRNRLVPFMLLGDVISSVGRKKRHCSSCQKIDASTTRTAPGISRLSSLFCFSFFYFFSFPPCFLSFFAVAFFFFASLGFLWKDTHPNATDPAPICALFYTYRLWCVAHGTDKQKTRRPLDCSLGTVLHQLGYIYPFISAPILDKKRW